MPPRVEAEAAKREVPGAAGAPAPAKEKLGVDPPSPPRVGAAPRAPITGWDPNDAAGMMGFAAPKLPKSPAVGALAPGAAPNAPKAGADACAPNIPPEAAGAPNMPPLAPKPGADIPPKAGCC